MERLANDHVSLSLLPIPDNPAGISVRFVLGGWIDELTAAGGYTFSSPDFPRDPIVGFGYPDEFIAPLFAGDEPARSETALKVGVGVINLARPGGYRFCEEPGVRELLPWEIRRDAASIRYVQEAQTGGVGYLLEKEIALLDDRPGFVISWRLTNRCADRPIQTLWYWHPFVAPGGMGHDCYVRLPETLVPAYDFVRPLSVDGEGRLLMPDDFTELPTQLLEFAPADHGLVNRLEVGNVRHGRRLVIEGDFPLALFRVWYERRVFSPEPFQYLSLMPNETRSWSITATIVK